MGGAIEGPIPVLAEPLIGLALARIESVDQRVLKRVVDHICAHEPEVNALVGAIHGPSMAKILPIGERLQIVQKGLWTL